MEYLNIIPIWFWGASVLLFLVIIACTCYAIYYEVKFMAQRRENKAAKEYNDILLQQLSDKSCSGCNGYGCTPDLATCFDCCGKGKI